MTLLSLDLLPVSDQCSHFIVPENTKKPKVFFVFSGDITWEHWTEMV